MGRGPRYSEAAAREAIAESRCWSDALRRLGMCPTGGGHAILKKYAELWEIPTSHFDPHAGRRRAGERRRRPLGEILVRSSSYSRGSLKRRLYAEGIKERRCERCGQTEVWHGRRMALILDHVNGVRDDNRLENLQIVCPNCAATLSTHCGRNVMPDRECRRCGKSFRPRARDQRHCSISCSKIGEGLGVARPDRRKVDRPPLEQLRTDLDRMSFCAVGRKYGVSDNAVRKWLVWYERQERRDQAA